MARSHLEAIAHSCDVDAAMVYSPTPVNREAFSVEMSELLGLDVTPVSSAHDAVADSDIVVTATNAMGPTFDPTAVSPGALVVAVTRREVGPALVATADRTLQLGEFTIGPHAVVPGLEFPQSGAGGFVAGDEQDRARLPWKHTAQQDRYPSLIEVMAGVAPGRTSPVETLLFINIGAQGVQFAAVAGRLYELALERGAGAAMDRDAFLQNVRD